MEDRVVESKEQRDKENAEELFDKIKSMLPAEAGFVKAEFEGPDIALYLKNTRRCTKTKSIVRSIASSIKKKLVIRSELNSLMANQRQRRS